MRNDLPVTGLVSFYFRLQRASSIKIRQQLVHLRARNNKLGFEIHNFLPFSLLYFLYFFHYCKRTTRSVFSCLTRKNNNVNAKALDALICIELLMRVAAAVYLQSPRGNWSWRRSLLGNKELSKAGSGAGPVPTHQVQMTF